MKVVLLQDVKGLGRRFDVKDVASGHGTNFLIPNGMALFGTPSNIKKMEIEKSKHLTGLKIKEDLIAKNIGDLKDLTIKIEVGKDQVNEKGHLFAAIHNERIAEEIKKQTRLDVLPEFIHTEKHIKEVGEHEITVKAGGKEAKFKLAVEVK